MRRRFWFGFVPLVFACTCVLAPRAETRVDCAGEVCPVYIWGNFGTYYAYYALVCNSQQPVNLNLQDRVTPNGCAAPCVGCVDFVAYKLEAKGAVKPAKKHHHHDPKLTKNGVVKAAPRTGYLANDTSKVECTELGPPVLVALQTRASMPATVKVMLYLVRVKPKKPLKVGDPLPPTRVHATGIEVLSDDDTIATITYDDILSTDGQVCTVQFGSVVYEVVLDGRTVLDQLK